MITTALDNRAKIGDLIRLTGHEHGPNPFIGCICQVRGKFDNGTVDVTIVEGHGVGSGGGVQGFTWEFYPTDWDK